MIGGLWCVNLVEMLKFIHMHEFHEKNVEWLWLMTSWFSIIIIFIHKLNQNIWM